MLKDYSNLIRQKVSDSAKLKYEYHSIICLLQDLSRNGKEQARSASPSAVSTVIGVERNSNYKQIYVMPKLERSLHFSAPTADFGDFINKPYPSLTSSNTSSTRIVSNIFIPSSVNFLSEDGSVYVNNHSACTTVNQMGTQDSISDSVLDTCNDLVVKMFMSGLSDCFTFNEKKRSGSNSSSKEPISSHQVTGSCSISLKSVIESQSRLSSDLSATSKRGKNKVIRKTL